MLKRLSCQLGRNDTLHTINITDMEYNLIDLQPFSQYFIVIQAFNGLIGEIYSSNYNTLPTGKLNKLFTLLVHTIGISRID